MLHSERHIPSQQDQTGQIPATVSEQTDCHNIEMDAPFWPVLDENMIDPLFELWDNAVPSIDTDHKDGTFHCPIGSTHGDPLDGAHLQSSVNDQL